MIDGRVESPFNLVPLTGKREAEEITPAESPKTALHGTKYDSTERQNTQRLDNKSAKVIDLTS